MWGTRFGTELWESLTRATRRDEIQKVTCDKWCEGVVCFYGTTRGVSI